VLVTNIGAGHAIPSSITELREVWIDLIVTDAAGLTIYRSGAIETDGRVDPKAVMYHSILHDKNGKQTYLPWRAVALVKEHLILPKQTVTEHYSFRVPKATEGPLNVSATLRYRAAPQNVMDELFGKGSFDIKVVDMTQTNGEIRILKTGIWNLFRK
jgi:hypothetical protein